MHHEGTECEYMNWIHVTHYNVGHNKLRSCCTADRGFLESQDSAFKGILCRTWLFELFMFGT